MVDFAYRLIELRQQCFACRIVDVRNVIRVKWLVHVEPDISESPLEQMFKHAVKLSMDRAQSEHVFLTAKRSNHHCAFAYHSGTIVDSASTEEDARKENTIDP